MNPGTLRNRAWRSAGLLLVFLLGAGGCRKYVTQPIYRRPVISSITAFPTVLGPGDSTMITIFATDPDGDSLVYDWEAYNGLVMRGPYGEGTYLYSARSSSRVFYRSPAWPYTNDTAFVFCSARDQKGGGDSRQVLILYKN